MRILQYLAIVVCMLVLLGCNSDGANGGVKSKKTTQQCQQEHRKCVNDCGDEGDCERLRYLNPQTYQNCFKKQKSCRFDCGVELRACVG